MKEIDKIYNKIKIILIVLIIFTSLIIILNKLIDKKSILSNYILNGDIDYSISNKDNSFGYTKDQSLYVSSIVDNINVNFDYKFNLDKKIKFKYKYKISSNVVASIDDNSIENSEVYRKETVLIDSDYNDVYDTKFNINNSVVLNYDYYDNIALEYDKSVNIPLKSKLLLNLEILLEYENGQTDEFKYYLSLPLEQTTFQIQLVNNDYKGSIYKNKNNSVIVFFNIIFILIIILIIAFMVYQISRLLKYKNEHYIEFKYKKIMRDYDNIVVSINAIPKDNDIVSVKVLYFKSMIDIQKELHIPILCYKSNEYIVYMIINNKLAYIYFLNNKREKI